MLDALESVLSPLLSVVPYVLLKFVAYAAWCFVGLRRHQPTLTRNQLASRAVGWGLFRLGLGLIFGTGIFLAQATVGGWARSPGVGGVVRDVAVYLAVYVPVRIVEWSIVSGQAFDRRVPAWIAGGVAVSIAADIPWIVAHGGHILPVGRFLC